MDSLDQKLLEVQNLNSLLSWYNTKCSGILAHGSVCFHNAGSEELIETGSTSIVFGGGGGMLFWTPFVWSASQSYWIRQEVCMASVLFPIVSNAHA